MWGHVACAAEPCDAALRWLPDASLTGDSGGEGFVERIFEPFELQMHLARSFPEDDRRASGGVGVGGDDEAATHITLSTPSIQARMDSPQFHVFMDVVSNIILAPVPAP